MKVKSESEVAPSCPTLSDPMDCSPPGSSVHGIFYILSKQWQEEGAEQTRDCVASRAAAGSTGQHTQPAAPQLQLWCARPGCRAVSPAGTARRSWTVSRWGPQPPGRLARLGGADQVGAAEKPRPAAWCGHSCIDAVVEGDWVDSWTVHVGQARRPTSCSGPGQQGPLPAHAAELHTQALLWTIHKNSQLYFLVLPVQLITDTLRSLVRSGLSLFSRLTVTAISGELYRQREEGSTERYHISPSIQTRVIWLVSASAWEIWLTSRRSLL